MQSSSQTPSCKSCVWTTGPWRASLPRRAPELRFQGSLLVLQLSWTRIQQPRELPTSRQPLQAPPAVQVHFGELTGALSGTQVFYSRADELLHPKAHEGREGAPRSSMGRRPMQRLPTIFPTPTEKVQCTVYSGAVSACSFHTVN